MKRIALTLFIALCLAAISFAQEPGDTLWTQTYGGSGDDYGQSVQQTTDGGYIIAGYTDSFGAGNIDFYLVKTDANGDTLWTSTYGGSDWDFSYSVEQTTDGGYIIAGYTTSFGAGDADFYLVKTDANGDTIWTRTYGGSEHDYGHSIQQTTDDGYIMTGYTRSFGAGDYDVYLVKIDSDGDSLWTRTYGGSQRDYAKSVQQTIDGGYIIAGYTESFGAGDYDVYLVKTDTDGDTMWTHTYGGSEYDNSQSVQQTTDSGYIVVGRTDSFGAGGDVYLLKTDVNGNTMWTHTYGGGNNDYGRSVQETNDGGYIIASNTNSFGAGDYDVYLVKTDVNGDTLWTHTYGGSDYDNSQSGKQTIDGGYIVVGGTNSFGAGDYDVYLVRVAGEPAGGCEYIPGDINGDGNVMGNDVTYGVRYFKGLGNPPPDSCPYDGGWLYSAGDANGNCAFTGSDITFLVAYFKGYNPEILWCPDTPPIGGLVVLGRNDDVTPAVLPKD